MGFLMRAIPGAHPAGDLRSSNFVPDKIVRIYRINSKMFLVLILLILFVNPVNPVYFVFKNLKRLALLTTVTEDMAMAAPAMIGLSSNPVNGYSTPAATGMPSTL